MIPPPMSFEILDFGTFNKILDFRNFGWKKESSRPFTTTLTEGVLDFFVVFEFSALCYVIYSFSF